MSDSNANSSSLPASPPEPGPRRAAVAFVMVTLVLDILALGITIPILPKLVETLSGGNTVNAALIFGVFSTAWALMQFLFQPLLGALSDRFGRRPVILLSNLGLGLDYILMALAPNIVWLFIGRVISGICAASFSTATAYISDVTPAEKRAQAFGMIGVAFGIGFVIGPAIGGLLGAIDPRLPLWVAGGFSLANAAYGYFVLPESLPPEKRGAFTLARANPMGSLALLRSDAALFRLAGVMFLYHLAHNVFSTVFVLHAGYKFGWGEDKVGLTLAGYAVFAAIVQGGLMKPAINRFGERTMLLFGLAAGVAGFLIMAFAQTPTAFWLGMPVMALWGFIGPSAQGLMSRLVSPSEQGRLQGAGGSLMGFAGLIGPLIFSSTFASAISVSGRDGVLVGAPYLVAAGLIALALGFAWRSPAAPMKPTT